VKRVLTLITQAWSEPVLLHSPHELKVEHSASHSERGSTATHRHYLGSVLLYI